MPLGRDFSVDEVRLVQTIFRSAGVSRLTLAELLDSSKRKSYNLVAPLPRAGRLGAADLGATRLHIAILRPDGSVLARHTEAAAARARIPVRQLLGIGMGTRGPHHTLTSMGHPR